MYLGRAGPLLWRGTSTQVRSAPVSGPPCHSRGPQPRSKASIKSRWPSRTSRPAKLPRRQTASGGCRWSAAARPWPSRPHRVRGRAARQPSGGAVQRAFMRRWEFHAGLVSTTVSEPGPDHHELGEMPSPDRKSTRLNSSHLVISYAVFCLKKKKKIKVLQVFCGLTLVFFHLIRGPSAYLALLPSPH